jgi:uncharacterized protein YhfF
VTGAEATFWAAFLASGSAPPDAAARYHSSFGVGSGSDEGAALILSGRKTATSALPADFGDRGPPRPGDLSILLAGGGRPVAVVETLSMAPTTLAGMDADFAAAYAEWPDLESCRAGMLGWYTGADPTFTDRSTLLAERLRVVWVP